MNTANQHCNTCQCAANDDHAGAGAPKPSEIKQQHKELKLFAYAMSGEIGKLESLVQDGVNVNATSVTCNSPVYGKFGKNTALMFAAASGRKDAVAFLLKHGANPSIRNLAGETAHNIALLNNDQEMVRLLGYAMERRRSSNDDNWDEKNAA